MNSRIIKLFTFLLGFTLIIWSCSSQPKKTVKKTNPVKPKITVTKPDQPKISEKKEEETIKLALPEIKREFRAAWIASVANINWPSKNDLSVQQQKDEAVTTLNLLQELNFNAVIFQIRPSADALYKSNLEPWSYFLTGQIGKSPYPVYDPLEFWIEEAHKRGMELHVWLNPYRAHHSSGGNVTSESMVKKSPDNVVRLKNGMYWFDPANEKTQNQVSEVVKDIVKRYDIDAIHFDDYFYPYREYNGGKDFPDDTSWNVYKKIGGTLSRPDWRRANVNKFVERINREIKEEKSYVKFGISPFGIWKPGYPTGITGSSQYDELYADAKLWLNEGWVDYFAPQLYWPIDSKGQSYPALLQWWKDENYKGRHLWPGINTVTNKVSDAVSEIRNEIKINREILKGDTGEIHWSVAGITKNYGMQQMLKNELYKEKALIPKSPWLKAKPLTKPTLKQTLSGGQIVLNWAENQPENTFQWVLYMKYGDTFETEILTKDHTHKTINKTKNGKSLNVVAIKAIDRLGNESEYAAVKVK
ncbi:MAG: family 10 glycosylhydrolase [Bergeyella sp.]